MIKVTLVRLSSCMQFSDWNSDYRFAYLELHTLGWEYGARSRSKKFPTFGFCYQYLKKLHDGKWLSDVEFLAAVTKVNRLRYDAWHSDDKVLHQLASAV